MKLKKIIKYIIKIENKFFVLPSWSNIESHLDIFPYRSPVAYIAAWGFLFFTRFFTIPGIILIGAIGPIISYSLISPESKNIYIVLPLCALIAINFIMGFVFRPKLLIKRYLPKAARTDSEVEIKYTIQNLRNIPMWNLAFDSMILPKRVRYVLNEANINCIPPNETVEIKTKIKCRQRGKYLFASPMVSSSFPFNISKSNLFTKGEKDKLLIYPKYETLNEFELPIGKKFQREGNSFLFNIGESTDFHGCREYRSGDDPKNIHWASSAKTGDLIVREFQEESISRVAIILDTSVGTQNLYSKLIKKDKIFPALEKNISRAAAITDYLTKGDLVIDIFTAGDDVYHFQAGRGQAYLNEILSVLSCVKPNLNNAIHKLKPSVFSMIDDIGAVILLILKMNDSRLEFIEELKQTGVNVKVILLDDILQ